MYEYIMYEYIMYEYIMYECIVGIPVQTGDSLWKLRKPQGLARVLKGFLALLAALPKCPIKVGEIRSTHCL